MIGNYVKNITKARVIYILYLQLGLDIFYYPQREIHFVHVNITQTDFGSFNPLTTRYQGYRAVNHTRRGGYKRLL